MSELAVLKAELREDKGKGASRRLRRLENKVPGIIYGGKKAPQTITLMHHKLMKALENESFYSSVLTIDLDGKDEKVILKDLHRHPYKPQILHLDLQRVAANTAIVKLIPLHFINEDSSKGVKAGGKASHVMTEVEIKCMAKDLPEHIEVDVSATEIEQTLHLSDIKLPKGASLTTDLSDATYDLPIFAIHSVKGGDDDDTSATEEPVSEEE